MDLLKRLAIGFVAILAICAFVNTDGCTNCSDRNLQSYEEKVDTDDGVTTYTCDRCGETFVGEPAMYSDGEVFCASCKKDMEWAHAIVGDKDNDD